MKTTMLNGLPVTMLSGLGCDCQKNNTALMGITTDYSGLLVAGALIGGLVLSSKTKASKGMNGFAEEVGKDVIGKVAIGAIVVGTIYFLVLKPVLTKVGVIESKEDKKRTTQSTTFATDIDSPFSPIYYKNKIGAKLLLKAEAQRLAKIIHEADGYFNDNELAVYSALRKLQYRTQLSWLADVFSQMYQKDLYSYLRAFLDDAEMDIVHGIVNTLK